MGNSERETDLGGWHGGCYEIEDLDGDVAYAENVRSRGGIFLNLSVGQALLAPAQARALAGALVQLADGVDPPERGDLGGEPLQSSDELAQEERELEQLAHATAERYAERFKERFVEKYMAGQREHGGHLPSLPYRELRKNTEEELFDLWAYHCAEGEAVRRLLSPDFRSGDGFANNTKVPLPEDWT